MSSSDETEHINKNRRKSSLDLLRLKERRRNTLAYLSQNNDLELKEDIMDFFQNEIRRKTSMDIENDCVDDFDSIEDKDKDIEIEIETEIKENNNKDNDNDDNKDKDIRNGEGDGLWNELIIDDKTRQQFEELAREYVGNIAQEKKTIQNEHLKLKQRYLKLNEEYKISVDHLNEKTQLIQSLENEVTTLSVNKQDLETNLFKLTLNLQHSEDTINNLNTTLNEYKIQIDKLTNNNLLKDENNNYNKEESNNYKDDNNNIINIQSIERDVLLNSSNEKIKTLNIEIKQLNEQIKEQQTLLLNNQGLIEIKNEQLKNIQKQYEKIKNKCAQLNTKNEQLQIDINAKNSIIEYIKGQNQKLENSNQELMILNSDLRHELTIYDQTIQTFKIKSKRNIQVPEMPTDRDSEEEEEEIIIPPIKLKDNNNTKQQRRKSVPTSIYEQNLDIIVSSVSTDEYQFMEDLSHERKTLQSRSQRKHYKLCHSDAEKEFFFMMVLTVKLELSMNLSITNSCVSDVLPQTLWLTAQRKSIALHQFHEYIKKELMDKLQKNKNKNKQIKHHWSSYNSMIGDKLRQNDLKEYKKNNPNWIDPETNTNTNIHIKNKHSKYCNRQKRAYTVDTNILSNVYSDKQKLIDEDEDEIIDVNKMQRRDSQNLKKSIIKSFNELQQQQRDKDTYDLL